MFVISIPTNMMFTGNQTLTKFHVSGLVGITLERDSVETMVTDTMLCSKSVKHDEDTINVTQAA